VAFLLRRIRLSIDHSLGRTTSVAISDAIEAISFRETSFGEETSRDRLTNPTQTSRHRYQARSQTIQITPANLIFLGLGTPMSAQFFESAPQPPSPPMAYAPGCARQTVTVPGADGKDQTVNVVRC
jgi:hypothetical protein